MRRSWPTRVRPAKPVVDFDCRPIEPGHHVTVVTNDWSVGAANWMQGSKAIVTFVGRSRIAVRFDGRSTTNFLPGRVVRVLGPN